ncbi:MAG TPA: DUF2752 domain-containing protein [Gemmataceae bacterium]|jgi:hypothetical protein
MIFRIERQPFQHPSQRRFRLKAAGFIALGVGILSVWNPLTRPGPRLCLMRNAFGLPCPMCGMTRGVALCLRGQPLDSLDFNPLAGPVLVLAVLLAVKWIIEVGTGRRIDVVIPSWLWRALVCAGCIVLLVNWTFMLMYRREDPFDTTWLGQFWSNVTGGDS